jgi:hypothetical protein
VLELSATLDEIESEEELEIKDENVGRSEGWDDPEHIPASAVPVMSVGLPVLVSSIHHND